MESTDQRRHAPATLRNRDAILEMLRTILPQHGLVLEVASGTGEHVVHFASALPSLTWQPSDPDPLSRASIAAWAASTGIGNVLPPLDLDVAAEWPLTRADAIVCINMLHIAPWFATENLFSRANGILPAGSLLYLYGPFRREGRELEPSNAAFDRSLRERNPEWGLREIASVSDCAAVNGFSLERFIEMPANNLSVLFRKDYG